jgi:CDP-6-deoxy-D-xylo-4-hexulose-3-dehydrase
MSAAVGIEQIAKLPGFIADRRRNAAQFLELMARYPQLMTQREIGEASWFGFSMVVRPDAPFSRADLVRAFQAAGIECRPVVAGNFAKNPVMRWLDHEVHGELTNADLIDTNGLFIGNREGDLGAELELLGSVLDELVGA